jgi:chemotaxis protein CheX
MNTTFGRTARHAVQPDPRWQGMLECAAVEVFGLMAGVDLVPFPETPAEVHGDHTAMVGLAGALCGMVMVRCSTAAASKLANLMLGQDASENPNVMGDALGELCNMVAGNWKSKISNLADHCMLSVPTVIRGDDYVLQTAQPHEGFQFALSYDGDPVWFSIVIHA